MTKTRIRQRRYQIYISADQFRHRKRRYVNRAKERQREYRRRERDRDPVTGLLRRLLVAPEIFTLSGKWREPVLSFLSDLKAAIIANQPVRIDFSKTKRMIADGTLLFFATLDRFFPLYDPKRLIKCNYPKDNIVEQVLQHVGIFGLLHKKHRNFVHHETVKYWCTASGARAEGAKIGRLSEHYEGSIVTPLTGKRYDGIIEAMTNSWHHAYQTLESRRVGNLEVGPRWWMFSQVRGGMLNVSFCDLGLGIPNSLRNSDKWRDAVREFIRHGTNRFSDASLIQ